MKPATCKDCPATPQTGARCDGCRLAHNARESARRAERKRRDQCWVCGVKALTGERVCGSHESYRSERMRLTAG